MIFLVVVIIVNQHLFAKEENEQLTEDVAIIAYQPFYFNHSINRDCNYDNWQHRL